MSNFDIITLAEEQKLSTKELLDYYKELRDFLKQEPYLDFSDNGIVFREKLNILIKKILKVIIKYDIKIDGLDLIPNEPVIYASSHQDFNDIINSIYAYPEHVLTLNASNISRILKMLLNINGVIYVDRNDKDSRKVAKYEMSKVLIYILKQHGIVVLTNYIYHFI